MPKRIETINQNNLESLFPGHPYLLLFRKKDWMDYASLLAHIYDFLEEEYTRVEYEVLRGLLIQFYAEQVENVEVKVTDYFQTMIVELQVLKDSYDSLGKRYIEATRAGKELLNLLESLLSSRRRFSGTGADTLLGTLNDLLLSSTEMSKAEAIRHHRDKIAAYQNDIKRIQENGVQSAELLPIHHSSEALFNQAQEAALHILAATEDVKAAIERERKILVENHLQQKQTPGANVRTIADFHLNLNRTEEFKSYYQAKELFSQLEGSQVRHKHSDISRILHQLKKKEVISAEAIKKSHLFDFTRQFSAADAGIKEKTKVQIQILQQQVSYALTTDSMMSQENLNFIFQKLYERKSEALDIVGQLNLEFDIPCVTNFGPIEANQFLLQTESPEVMLTTEDFTLEELRYLMESLKKSEEESVKNVLRDFKAFLAENGSCILSEYPLMSSLVSLYVLLEADLLDSEIEKELQPPVDILLTLYSKQFFIKQVPNYKFNLRKSNAIQV